MPQDYQAIVLATYKKMRDAGELPLNLLHPTTAKLKRESLKVFDKRYTPEDDDILSEFFNAPTIGPDFRQTLAGVTSGTFRALWNHLNDDTINTNERNSDLLAWLIDFKPRPSFRYYQAIREGKKGEVLEDNNGEIDGDGITGDVEENLNGASTVTADETLEVTDNQHKDPNPEIDEGSGTSETSETGGNQINPEEQKSYKKIIISCAIILVIGIGSLLLWLNKADRETISPDEKCMYWVGDHYEAIVCDKETSTPKITLNIEKLKRLKKINTPDKLTKYDLGKVWYAKIYNQVEFYTDSGMHPIDTNRVLRPLTVYMLKTHTSYYRYLLSLLFWAMGGIGLLWLLIVLARKYLVFK